ncbi:MAG: hypothetical protein M3004_00505 [Bacteroidota bacterium]|nr:hypothetical protein [Bacteroidota bacterium]
MQQYSPDGDTSHFWYDRLGRLVISQNKEQQTTASYNGSANRFSYTKYDGLGRITEVGEKSGADDISTLNTKDTTALIAWMETGTNKQITKTIYDQPDQNIVTNTDITDNQSLGSSRKRVVASLFSENGIFASNAYDNGTHYSYDINGNVKTLWQEIGKMRPLSDNGIKRMDYDYDLVSGKVNKAMYQEGKGDQFYYKYLYDAENRVTDAQSSRDGLLWLNDASYTYYLHGPLARTELGQYKLQGIDYAYTLQGWLKGINSAVLNPATDMGKDGNGFATTFGRVVRDVYGFTLGYFNNDFTPIGGTGASLGTTYSSGTPNSGNTGSALYNGNISNTTLALNKFDTGKMVGYTYAYDQLNRLMKMNRHTPAAGTTWDNTSIIEAYKEQISYDANGNILGYLRNGANQTGKPLAMDSFNYHYNTGNNQLNFVTDSVAASNYTEDIDNQSSNNYSYDKIGNLKKDVAEGIDTIRWTVYGKINKIVKGASNTNITYDYDAAGNRTTKQVSSGDTTNTTFYVRDASGNVMGIYSNKNNGTIKWDEQHLYGSSRLGIWRWSNAIPANPPNVITSSISDSLLYGTRNYELTNHLGNVLATISDKKIGHALNDTTIDYFNADVVTANDYYPGGMMMPGRQFAQSNSSYRYGFNGQEKSNEIKGEGNSYTAQFWEYDPRLVRRWNLDPIKKPWQSDYATFSNNPMWKLDPNGDDDFFNSDGTFSHRTTTGTSIKIITKDGVRLLSQIAPNSSKNIRTLVKIVAHYAPEAGIPVGTTVGISPTTSNLRNDPGSSLAFTNATGIMVSAKGGVNPDLNNYNNLTNTLLHEEKHREAKDPEKGREYKFTDHLAIYEKQLDDKSFKSTDNSYKMGMATNYASYLLGALNADEIDDKQFDDKVKLINNKLKPFNVWIYPQRSSAPLPAVKVYGRDNNNKVVKNVGFVNPRNDPH